MARRERIDRVDRAVLPQQRVLVGITLTCGHIVTTRNPPLNNHAQYSCTAGTGCGYSLSWTKYKNHTTQLTSVNPAHPGNEES